MARWTEQELLVAMNLYCRTPFGRMHNGNPDIVALAAKLDRTPSAIAMKLCNFASLDPTLTQKGLKGASKGDRAMWEAFHADWNGMSAKSETAFDALTKHDSVPASEPVLKAPSGPSEMNSMVTTRRHQGFFRRVILSSYESRCAVTGIAIPQLLIASHIIPWEQCEARRTDPTNGICLNALHDKAFDRHLITFDEDYRLVVSPALKANTSSDFHTASFLALEGQQLHLPHRFKPDPKAMEAHREQLVA